MKPQVLLIELGIKELDKLKAKLNPKNAKMIYAYNFLNILDQILYENIHIILLSDIRGDISTANYIKLFKNKDPNYRVIIISINAKIDEERKKSYIENKAEDIFAYNQIKEIQKCIVKTADIVSKEEHFLHDWNKCTRMAMKFIRNNYHLNENFYQKMQNELKYSKSMIHYSVKKNTGKTTGEWIQHYRVKGSIQLLKATNLDINAIKGIVGYKSAVGFIKTFKKATGYSPAKYKKEKL